ncbi:phosphoglycerate mutase family protein, partial [Haematococcus lacustris]
MCVGHNKGWEEAASSWSGRAIKLGTATAALLQVVAASWSEALAEDGTGKWECVAIVGADV